MTPFQERLRGSIPAMMRALDRDPTVNPEAMRKTARRLLDNGICATTGLMVRGPEA